MTCPRTEDLSAYRPRLPTRQEAALQQHLGTCPMRRTQLDARRRCASNCRACPRPPWAVTWPRSGKTGWHLASPSTPGGAGEADRQIGWQTGCPTGYQQAWPPAQPWFRARWLGGLLLGTGSVATSPAPTLTRVRPRPPRRPVRCCRDLPPHQRPTMKESTMKPFPGSVPLPFTSLALNLELSPHWDRAPPSGPHRPA